MSVRISHSVQDPLGINSYEDFIVMTDHYFTMPDDNDRKSRKCYRVLGWTDVTLLNIDFKNIAMDTTKKTINSEIRLSKDVFNELALRHDDTGIEQALPFLRRTNPSLVKSARARHLLRPGDKVTGCSSRDNQATKMDNLQRYGYRKKKRNRSLFTTEQVNYLEEQFKKYRYLTSVRRREISIAIDLPEKAVKVWFQNRRMKAKKGYTPTHKHYERFDHLTLQAALDKLNNEPTPSTSAQQTESLPLLTSYDKMSGSKNVQIDTRHHHPSVSSPSRPKLVPWTLPGAKIDTPQFITFPEFKLTDGDNRSTETNKKESCAFHPTITPDFLRKPEYITPTTEQEKTTDNQIIDQTMPQDLSSRKIHDFAANPMQEATKTPLIPEYNPILPNVPFYPPPYLSHGGILWQPVRPTATVTSSSSQESVSVPASDVPSNTPIVRQSERRVCACDRHAEHDSQQKPPILPEITKGERHPDERKF